jgi:hypothetical protein
MIVEASRTFLAYAFQCWGKGSTEAEAIKNLKKTGLYKKGNPISLFICEDPEVYVEEIMGNIVTKQGTLNVNYFTMNKIAKEKGDTSGRS